MLHLLRFQSNGTWVVWIPLSVLILKESLRLKVLTNDGAAAALLLMLFSFSWIWFLISLRVGGTTWLLRIRLLLPCVGNIRCYYALMILVALLLDLSQLSNSCDVSRFSLFVARCYIVIAERLHGRNSLTLRLLLFIYRNKAAIYRSAIRISIGHLSLLLQAASALLFLLA